MVRKLDIYTETGKRRTFAAALDWPGWCRSGRDETAALQALLDYGPRYAKVLHPARLGFEPPTDLSAFAIVERLAGNAVTDFGVPEQHPAHDIQPLDEAELQRQKAILKACWRAFDTTVEMARDKSLRSGPRGGGRTVAGVVEHVLGGERGYLSSLGGKAPQPDSTSAFAESLRQAILKALAASARCEIAPVGPRGGKRWPPRYFVRREAWHVLDHLWEIEDRLVEKETR